MTSSDANRPQGGEKILSIATWNVNSINARLANVREWVSANEPDILCLQELKCPADRFPTDAFAELGYTAEICGQKSYNGVAILHRDEDARDIVTTLPGDESDTQARYIEATIHGLRVVCLYAPNGNPVDEGGSWSAKYRYKLAWMERLRQRLSVLLATNATVVACGDYNVIPEPRDCYDPVAWADDALFRPETRQAFRRLETMGYYDAFRALRPEEGGAYTFWDYQGGAWQHNHGIRIDHALLSPQAADRLDRVWIDASARAKDKASDHTPLVVSLR